MIIHSTIHSIALKFLSSSFMNFFELILAMVSHVREE